MQLQNVPRAVVPLWADAEPVNVSARDTMRSRFGLPGLITWGRMAQSQLFPSFLATQPILHCMGCFIVASYSRNDCADSLERHSTGVILPYRRLAYIGPKSATMLWLSPLDNTVT